MKVQTGEISEKLVEEPAEMFADQLAILSLQEDIV
jgi:hypothetical protein